MILLKNGKILQNDQLVNADLLISGDKIVKIATNIQSDDDYIIKDLKGMWVIPAGVDVHAHLREPGFEHKETIATGTRSASKGGIATMISMPNLIPTPDCEKNLNYQLDIIKKDAVVRVYPSASVSVAERGETLSDIEKLNDLVEVFTDDGLCVNNLQLLEDALSKSKKIIASHAEAKGAQTAEEAEYVAVERELELLKKYPTKKYHFCHLSTARAFELVKLAKENGLDVTCEVMPHHFALNKTQIKDANWKMNPPLRSEADRLATIDALKSGIATMIATDHAPHSPEEKAREYQKAPNGIIGFETFFPVTYTYLVKTGIISHQRFVELTSKQPALRFNLPYGEIREGGLSDITVLDIETEREYTENEILSKSKNTPFIGYKLFGYPRLTLVAGNVVFDDLN